MSGKRAHILVVEDEQPLALGIRDNLAAEGHAVTLAASGPAGLARMGEGDVDLVLLDVMLPGADGYSVCAALRARGDHTPVLFVSAKNTPAERVHGLRVGGDDYLGKPFHLAELLGRVAALLRRRAWWMPAPRVGHQGPPAQAMPPLTLGDATIEFDGLRIRYRDGHADDVPARELHILALLARHRGEVVSRDAILDAVWGHDVYPSSRTVDNFIVRLRRRVEPDPALPRYLFTVRGVGYRLAPEELSPP